MDNTRIIAWFNYHRTFSKTSNMRLATAMGKSVRVYQERLQQPEKFTLGELLQGFDELRLTHDQRVDFFEEVVRAWEDK